ncbi:replication initiation negative regulator SeqA [Colwellia sp. E2M01]|uniref:replication initiation negative regulator SeqA n=1 Tax=Colwellia sp. E2M01 TaxID=2841561 RepID=UPI001C08E807|nr:replication initiation negative regulator SeqA [Colwellia sp. E2M01]MBU2869174.1 replication initiation negative regulator SeqA [Colwellia sp. E2M01]
MKNIEIDEDLYQYIATNTQFIGESASAILRRLLNFDLTTSVKVDKDNELKESDVENNTPELTDTNEVVDKVSEANSINKVSTNSNETVFNFINKEELAMQRGAVGRFLLILAGLYRAHPEQFSVVTEISGRDRLYFADSENKLAESGSSTKPRQIPDSPFWVITNSNTTRKKMMLTKASISLGYNDDDVEKIRELL